MYDSLFHINDFQISISMFIMQGLLVLVK